MHYVHLVDHVRRYIECTYRRPWHERLLRAEVVVAEGAGCCGARTHLGHHHCAMASARTNIEAWSQEIEKAGLDAIIVNASGSGTMVKEYGFLFRTQAEPLRGRAEKASALALDISEYLTRIRHALTLEPPALTVAYHSVCSLQHGQQVTAEPKALLRAGFTIVEPAEPHICCGSANTHNLLQPEIATRLRERKLANGASHSPGFGCSR